VINWKCKEMPRIYPDPERPKPTPMETSSRFAWGLIAGFIIGFVIAGIARAQTFDVFAAAIGASGLVCAVLAVPYDEEFWVWLRDVVRALQWF